MTAAAKPVKVRQTAADVIAELTLGDQRFELHRSLVYTTERWFGRLDWRRVAPAYRALTKDLRAEVDREAAKEAVLGAIQLEWYKAAGRPAPEKLINRQQQRLEQTAMSTTNGDSEKKGKAKVDPAERENLRSSALTIGGLIRHDLLAEKSNDDILKHVKERFPKSAATEKDIAYYRYHLRKEGRLPMPVKTPKAPKTTSAKVKKAATPKKAKAKKTA